MHSYTYDRCAVVVDFVSTLAALLTPVLGHWNFESLIINGQDTGVYEYVRKTKNSNSPIQDLGFWIRDVFGHPGIQQVWLSKAPRTAQSYKGDGGWFKIYSLTTSNLTADPIYWAPFVNNVGIQNLTFTLPKDLPSGQYLMRAEGLALPAQRRGVRRSPVPGAYTGNEPGILVGLWWPPLRNYTAPGPAVWPNKCEDHSANILGKTSDGDSLVLAAALGGAQASAGPDLAMGEMLGGGGVLFPRQQQQAATGTQNLQTFTGALGGIKADPVTNSGQSDRPFEVDGDTFTDFASAAQRSCDNQKNKCAQVANSGSNAGFEVSACDSQDTQCKNAINTATQTAFLTLASSNAEFDFFCES
ncbi:hypothetical protein diail_10344 [Diaporthe ilicicola]|nr:hypothetical protein diail_10344 [Diaporthe ilicicola]